MKRKPVLPQDLLQLVLLASPTEQAHIITELTTALSRTLVLVAGPEISKLAELNGIVAKQMLEHTATFYMQVAQAEATRTAADALAKAKEGQE